MTQLENIKLGSLDRRIGTVEVKMMSLESKMVEQGEKLDSMENKIDLIYGSMVGGKLQGKGVIKRMECLEDQSEKTKRFTWLIGSVATILSTLALFFNQIKNIFN